MQSSPPSPHVVGETMCVYIIDPGYITLSFNPSVQIVFTCPCCMRAPRILLDLRTHYRILSYTNLSVISFRSKGFLCLSIFKYLQLE